MGEDERVDKARGGKDEDEEENGTEEVNRWEVELGVSLRGVKES